MIAWPRRDRARGGRCTLPPRAMPELRPHAGGRAGGAEDFEAAEGAVHTVRLVAHHVDGVVDGGVLSG